MCLENITVAYATSLTKTRISTIVRCVGFVGTVLCLNVINKCLGVFSPSQNSLY